MSSESAEFLELEVWLVAKKKLMERAVGIPRIFAQFFAAGSRSFLANMRWQLAPAVVLVRCVVVAEDSFATGFRRVCGMVVRARRQAGVPAKRRECV